MTIDEAIKELTEIALNHGGDVPVRLAAQDGVVLTVDEFWPYNPEGNMALPDGVAEGVFVFVKPVAS
ncbi:MAG: hypothetical protein AAFQ36_09450 [Pseudomonadota bacterium]